MPRLLDLFCADPGHPVGVHEIHRRATTSKSEAEGLNMATQEYQIETTSLGMTLLDRVVAAIALTQDERTTIEEAFTKAENKYAEKIAKLDYHLETLRRVKERLTSGE